MTDLIKEEITDEMSARIAKETIEGYSLEILKSRLQEHTKTVDILADMTWGKELDCKQVCNLLNDHNNRIKGISVYPE